ncbi:polysaccharide pyruvyl transferase family protein [Arenimonas oryziterrae]|uniref:polysaccharide pyruvyl transferase family protein n=1 Tax=Arenimonas oryziterrae TaxID=498055 RepID=UPI00138AD334|nr:polysaccharide pyruvyl transferase family protein [Arenimonas oryziterrae]
MIPVVVVNDTRVDRHHGCTRVMTAIEALVASMGGQVIATSPAHRDWKSQPGFIAAFERARLVLVNGEGTLHHDRPAGKMLLEVGAWARQRGVPSALINAGWEANGPELLAQLPDFDLLAVRDSRSAKEIGAAGHACRVVPDLSLYGSSPDRDAARQGIAVTDSVERTTALALDRLRRRMGARASAIQYREPGPGAGLRFLREAFAARDLLSPGFAFGLLSARLAQLHATVASAEDYLDQLARTRLLVSGRFHACTLALAAGTPFVAVASNTSKIAALVEDVELPAWRANTSLAPADIDLAASRGWEKNETAAIENYLSEARSKAEGLFRDLRELVQ